MTRKKAIWMGCLLAASLLALAGCGAAQAQQGEALPSPIGTQAVEASPSPGQTPQINAERAKQIAYAHANIAQADVQSLQVELDREDGAYEVEFVAGQMRYAYDVDAQTGEIRAYECKKQDGATVAPQPETTQPTTPQPSAKATPRPNATQPPAQTAQGQWIGEQKAKEIALQHANVQASKATFTKVKQDWDDGRAEYEVEFDAGQYEYEYEIDAQTGRILSQERERKSSTKPAAAQQPSSKPATATAPSMIEQSQAKRVALSHANVSESQVSRLKVELDRDDGAWIYEVEFHVGRMEYSYDVDAQSGRIRKFERELDD